MKCAVTCECVKKKFMKSQKFTYKYGDFIAGFEVSQWQLLLLWLFGKQTCWSCIFWSSPWMEKRWSKKTSQCHDAEEHIRCKIIRQNIFTSSSCFITIWSLTIAFYQTESCQSSDILMGSNMVRLTVMGIAITLVGLIGIMLDWDLKSNPWSNPQLRKRKPTTYCMRTDDSHLVIWQ